MPASYQRQVDRQPGPPAVVGVVQPHALGPEHQLLVGRKGEKVLEHKAAASDAIAVLSGFVLAFALQQLLEVDVSEYASRALGSAHTLAMCISAASGMHCVLCLTFLSAKLRRLIGRSVLRFGEPDVTAAALSVLYGQDGLSQMLAEREVTDRWIPYRFHAQAWYSGNGTQPAGAAHFQSALLAFPLQLLSFTAAVLVQLWDRTDAWAAAIATVVLTLVPIATLAQLYRTGAVLDLV